MGYAEHNLITGETITFRGRLHVAVLARAIIVTVLLDAIAVGLIVLAVANREMNVVKYVVPAFLLLLVSTIIMAAAVMSRNAAEFVVTNKRVIVKLGIIHKRTSEIFLNKIETVAVDQTIAGRMLGYGSIVVCGTGGTSESFHRIANPFEFRRQIQEQIGRMIGQPASTGN